MLETTKYDNLDALSLQELANNIKDWGEGLGFRKLPLLNLILMRLLSDCAYGLIIAIKAA